MNEKIETDVVLTAIDIPFLSMVGYVFKWVLAALPAALVFGFVGAAIWFNVNR
jgi:hypothetical protein